MYKKYKYTVTADTGGTQGKEDWSGSVTIHGPQHMTKCEALVIDASNITAQGAPLLSLSEDAGYGQDIINDLDLVGSKTGPFEGQILHLSAETYEVGDIVTNDFYQTYVLIEGDLTLTLEDAGENDAVEVTLICERPKY